MNSRSAIVATLLALGLCATATAEDAAPTSKRQADAAWTAEGLQKADVAGFDLVYVRPGASLAAYGRIQLEPVSVAFRRDFGKSSMAGATRRVRPEDLQEIKDGLSTLVQEKVRGELATGGYALSDAAGEDVLTVELSIVNLYINAPDLPNANNARVYTTSVGEMTLVAELRDSVSGELLARILDRAVGRESMRPEFTTRADNVAEANNLAEAWAKSLRKGLDQARKVDP